MKDCDTLAAAPAICPSGNGFSCRFVVDQPLQFFQPLRFVSAEYAVFSILYHLSKSAEIAGCCHSLHQSRFHPFIFRFRTVKNRIGKRSQVDIHRRNPLRQFLVIDKALHLDLGSKQFQLHREFQNSHDEEFQVRIFAMMHLAAFAMERLLPHDTALTLYRDEMEEAIRLLEKDFREKLSLQQLADAVGMSRTNFRRVFKEYYGIAPMEYRIRKRMEVIQATMSFQRMPMKEIAERFGYPDAFSFSRQFKQYLGMSPKEFFKKQTDR